ncbi:hypothetical protein clem_13835 [Legionella clemsonensis]|uniref:Uncharacterized protein n=1 Tax=Legionella clemsonensis TaxID=1867846 RepID=A0A222P638_9GAMM|nr:hypothetical protein clem_13835 [Legionella clemsonensis]
MIDKYTVVKVLYVTSCLSTSTQGIDTEHSYFNYHYFLD